MKKTKSFNLFLFSIILVVLTLLVASFWDSLELGANKIPLAVSTTISFGLSIIGLVFGIKELKQIKSKKTWTGLIGNSVVIMFFMFIIIYSLNG